MSAAIRANAAPNRRLGTSMRRAAAFALVAALADAPTAPHLVNVIRHGTDPADTFAGDLAFHACVPVKADVWECKGGTR